MEYYNVGRYLGGIRWSAAVSQGDQGPSVAGKRSSRCNGRRRSEWLACSGAGECRHCYWHWHWCRRRSSGHRPHQSKTFALMIHREMPLLRFGAVVASLVASTKLLYVEWARLVVGSVTVFSHFGIYSAKYMYKYSLALHPSGVAKLSTSLNWL